MDRHDAKDVYGKTQAISLIFVSGNDPASGNKVACKY
jgi:hypothetical protein